MPVAADLSRCIPFTSAFCHRMALCKQVALFNLSGLTSSRYRLSLPGNCDDAIKREISFLSENIVSIVVLLLHLILFTIRRLHRITLASLFLIRTDCLFDALVSPFGIVSFMPWNYRFQGMKQNGITPWWVILFMTLPCSQLCSLLRIYNPIEQETRNNWYYPNFPPSGRLRHTLNSLHFATL